MLPIVLILLAAQAPTPMPAPAGAVTTEKARILVLDLQAVGVTDGEAALLRDAIAARLGRSPKIEVLSSGEVKRLVEVEETKAIAGCDTSSSSCLAEIAGALGAGYVVSGNVGKLGASMVMNLSLLSGATSQAVARATVSGTSLDEIMRNMGADVDGLLVPIVGAAPAPPPPEPVDVLFLSGVGATAIGAGALIGGAVWGALLEGTLGDPKAALDDKEQALEQRVPALGLIGGGLVVGVVGGVLLGLSLSEGT